MQADGDAEDGPGDYRHRGLEVIDVEAALLDACEEIRVHPCLKPPGELVDRVPAVEEEPAIARLRCDEVHGLPLGEGEHLSGMSDIRRDGVNKAGVLGRDDSREAVESIIDGFEVVVERALHDGSSGGDVGDRQRILERIPQPGESAA